MSDATKIMLISGSLRAGSVNTAVLRTAAEVAGPGIEATLYGGMGELPHFNPDADTGEGELDPVVVDLRARLRDSDAVLFCTPEYAGALPGSFKNLLDWTVGGGETYDKPVAWINASSRPIPGAAAAAHASLRAVLGYTGVDLVPDACRRIVVPREAIDTTGRIAAAELRARIADVAATLAAHAANRPPERSEAARPWMEAAVERADTSFFSALRAHDLGALERLLADDFSIIDVITGGRHTRAAFLRALGEGRMSFPTIEPDPAELSIRVHGAGIGVVTGRTRMRIAGLPGGPAELESRYTHVFRAAAEDWQLMAAQGTAVLAG